MLNVIKTFDVWRLRLTDTSKKVFLARVPDLQRENSYRSFFVYPELVVILSSMTQSVSLEWQNISYVNPLPELTKINNIPNTTARQLQCFSHYVWTLRCKLCSFAFSLKYSILVAVRSDSGRDVGGKGEEVEEGVVVGVKARLAAAAAARGGKGVRK